MKQLRPQIREFIAAGDLANTKRYRVLTVEEEQVWDRIFQPIVQS
jgi:hypothetical protein